MSLTGRIARRIRPRAESDATARERTVISPDNRPKPLRNPPFPLAADTVNQMSFGERAALEGLLSQLKPRVSLEIGTYEGGSLRRVAAHSGQVHTFDLDDLVPDKRSLPNVTFHQGDSKETVPSVLEQLAASGTLVDFAFVDGDHSAAGVRADLENLLASPACARTVILLHDTFNSEVRGGIDLGRLTDHPKVVYAELDFVAGYEFAGGDFDGQRWGGLGLVILGDRASDGYGPDPVQTRYVPIFDLVSGLAL